MAPPLSSSGAAGPPVALTSAELRRHIDGFVRDFLADKSQATRGTYRRSLNEFERWVVSLGGTVGFDAANLQAYKRYLTRDRGLHEVSVSTYLTALRRLCAYLVDIGRLDDNPARHVKGNRRPTRHSRDVLSRDEVDRLVGTLQPRSQIEKRDHAMLFLMLFSGLSEIEVVRADVQDLEQTLLGWYLRVQGKGRVEKDQQVPVDPPVMQRIRLYLDTRAPIRPEDPLFVSHGHRSDGDRLNTRSIRTRINHYLQRAGLKRSGITPHSLTHTAALLWLGDGMSVEEVQARMRHGTLDTTLIHKRKEEAK